VSDPEEPTSSRRGPTITTTAVGRAQVVPDQVRVSLGVDARAGTVGDALQAAAEGVDRLLELLDATELPSADRQTSGLGVQPAWDGSRESGHIASYSLTVVVSDLAEAGRLVRAAAESIGDRLRVHGFALAVRNPRGAQQEARQTAVRACRAQAEQMAVAAGGELGGLLRLTEGPGRHGQPMTQDWSEAVAVAAALDAKRRGGVSSVAVAVTGVWRLRLADVDAG
jgi:uncharacterized protein YggE